MLSRVAASFYWLSRYIERSDGLLRMLKTNYASSQDSVAGFSWEPIMRIFSGADDDMVKSLGNESRAVLKFMVMERDNPNSIVNLITLARENARSVQEHIPTDLWQCINEYYHTVKEPRIGNGLRKDDPIGILDVLIKEVMLYYGTAEITMERGQARSFMNIGKYLERAIQSIDILDVKFGPINTNPDLLLDITYWKHLLQSIGGYELYQKTYRDGLEAHNVIEQVILNNDFPRSVIYSVNNIQRYFDRLKNNSNVNDYREISFQIGKLQSNIKYSSVKSISQMGLHQYLTGLRDDLYKIGNSMNEYYFANS
ncbi:alpha-E domain-containing protein [Mucilaginibacter achroorhodeus]|uniref:Alpha-E domain-containing protein n=1 Tax=Mucilaginibacter achroorhodeus TaxID=2599294 RepID=A0A563TY88_9SPHI|nr:MULTISPECIES: alpha-E domain-containing protein [Mucilaginibacter]QXV66008.1 alpha-E domain-containing protein [Mucilaginibacter sp. 21P]TWR24223.1 alpha-E domain-containing protein [Mucilaginibacter achroorhodeus]